MPFDHSGRWYAPITVHPSELHAPLPSGYSYENLVPPFTGLTPRELLDRYYSGQEIFDWTDPPGISGNQLEGLQNHLGNAEALSLPGLVGKRNCLPAEPVPVYGAGSVLGEPQDAVEFRNQDQDGPSKGTFPI